MSFSASSREVRVFSGPLYAQVATMLRGKIASAEWNPAAPIPNEVALARTMGVSIGTMRKALEILEAEHLIERQQGRGTFVVEVSEETELQRFSGLSLGGAKVRAKPERRRLSIAEASEMEQLKLVVPRGSRVIRIETLLRGEQGYAAIETAAVCALRFAGLEAADLLDAQLLFPVYRERYQIVVAAVEERITCCSAESIVAAQLGVRAGSPLMAIERVARERNGAAVEYSHRLVSPGAAAYTVTMT